MTSDPIGDLGLAEAATYLGMSEASFRRHNKQGTGPMRRKDGRKFLFRPDHLDSWKETLYTASTKTAPRKKTAKVGKAA